jgi:hypothetical protein
VSLLSRSLEAKLIPFLLEAIAWAIRAKRTWRLTRHTNTAFFRCLLHHRVCTRVACASWSLTASRSLFLSRGIENGQLLQYGHAYQLSVCANVKTMDARACVPAERCENGNDMIPNGSYNGTERYLFIGRYCRCSTRYMYVLLDYRAEYNCKFEWTHFDVTRLCFLQHCTQGSQSILDNWLQ